jgi:acetyltransferase-like isoleucine patch superfamily enzyme
VRLWAAIIVIFLPWRLKRRLYSVYFKYKIHPSAAIGLSFVNCDYLEMEQGSMIGHLNVIKGLKTVRLSVRASIGRLNWITGFPVGTNSPHFSKELSREPCLLVGNDSAITNRHIIDCTNTVEIGQFAIVAGFRSQILTHSISVRDSIQASQAVRFGDYTFVGTGSIILPGAHLPSYSILGAGSVLNKRYTEEYVLYAGNPAVPVKQLDSHNTYFQRQIGFVT